MSIVQATIIDQEYQKFTDEGSFYAHSNMRDAGELAYLGLGVAGEAGELADEIKKIVRVTGFNPTCRAAAMEFESHLAKRGKKILDESSDVLWYITRLCSYLDVTISELMIYNTFKLYNRHHKDGAKELPWPLTEVSYEDASKLMLRIESQIMGQSVSTSTDTGTSSKPSA